MYGPGRVTAHVLSDMTQSARDHRKIEYVLRAVEPPVHIDDAARLIVALLSVEQWRPTYCLVQDNIPHAQLADIVARQIGEPVEIYPVEGQPPTWREKLDGTAVSAATGVSYQVRVEQGIADFVRPLA